MRCMNLDKTSLRASLPRNRKYELLLLGPLGGTVAAAPGFRSGDKGGADDGGARNKKPGKGSRFPFWVKPPERTICPLFLFFVQTLGFEHA